MKFFLLVVDMLKFSFCKFLAKSQFYPLCGMVNPILLFLVPKKKIMSNIIQCSMSVSSLTIGLRYVITSCH